MEGSKKFFAITTDLKTPTYGEVEGRDLAENEVLIKVEAAPINPSDQYMSVGRYGVKKLFPPTPVGVGFEGSGIVVEVHESVSSDLVGKKAVFVQDPHSASYKSFNLSYYKKGTWRQYLILKKSEVTILPEDVDLDVVCGYFGNPVTVCGFIDIYQKGGHKAMIHDAACSALGKMLVKFTKTLSIPLINIVRRDEQAKILEALGAEYILNSTSETFTADLTELAKKLEATVFFDAVAGDITGQVLDCMPHRSTVYLYGALSGKDITYHPGDFIFKENTISYFWLLPWLNSITAEERKKWVSTVITDLSSGCKVFGQIMAKTYPLSLFREAIAESSVVASTGKVILKPHEN